ncbi:dehydrogenase [Haladaptatus sp. R4]|uniref:SDR family NAD(P)-dependent oxidoreductase n=1 Tax=Haladaptatus sp. R4 TaxID=1679489 RepID=UPI0007B49A05|nr:SDR family NAD(P)-dependent oxidoreductase [Haladaptatus sp. R4]KZN23718.1 dehydrogenase [Haladaptatus sp. R4]
MNEPTPERIVVMTGATSGIGEHAVRRIAAQPDTQVIIGARGSGRIVPEGSTVIQLDLASLESVRSFSDAVKQRLADDRIDMLVLNAGIQYPNADQRSDDGFEKTFAVNHLGHYLLARELLPSMAEESRLVITTSDTHDPTNFPFAPTGLDTQALAHPSNGGLDAGIRAYSASKLCNLLTAQAFAELDEVNARDIQIIAYNPGLTPDTSLMRNVSGLSGVIIGLMTSGFLGRMVFGFLSRFNENLYPETSERAGVALAQLALGAVTPPSGSIYASLVKGKITFPDPSELARSDEARDRLWRDSAEMVGVME